MSEDTVMLANRLRKRRRQLRKWVRRQEITCYRLYARDIPEYPLIVDWYDGEAVVWLYQRKRDETPQQVDAWRRRALAQVEEGLELSTAQIFVKERRRQTEADRYERLQGSLQTRLIEEKGLQFEVNLSDYIDTGLFLDHRITRAIVRRHAAGRRFLNLFAYTGTFTCYAIAGGAAATTTVDISRTYCDWTIRNLTHNGFARSEEHRVIQTDCLLFLQQEHQRRARYDLIVCDPPTFSASKRMESASFSVVRDHVALIRNCARLLAPGGQLYFSTNARRFRLDQEKLPASLTIEDLTRQTTPDDFQTRTPHLCWRMTQSC